MYLCRKATLYDKKLIYSIGLYSNSTHCQHDIKNVNNDPTIVQMMPIVSSLLKESYFYRCAFRFSFIS